MPREGVSHTCYLKTLFYESQKKEKTFGIVPVAELFQEKTTPPASADTSTNCCDLAIVFWNIPLEQTCSVYSRGDFLLTYKYSAN